MTDRSVDVSGASVVQVGDHNTQHSYLTVPAQSHAAADLQALHPRAAAARIRRLPADEAAALVAQLAVQSAVELLQELLGHDEPTAVAVLTSMHPARARELITHLAAAADWLADLPRAAAAIRKVHDVDRATLGDETGSIVRVDGPPATPTGFRLTCTAGVIYWSADTHAVPVAEPILAYHEAAGGPAGRLGFPRTPRDRNTQLFQGPGRDMVVTSRHGTFSVDMSIAAKVRPQRLEGPGAPLGETEERDGAWLQRCVGGDIHIRHDGEPFLVFGEIRQAWAASSGRLGLATTVRMAGPTSFAGATGWVQHFADSASQGRTAEIYSTGTHGTTVVCEPVRAVYEQLGGAAGWLGYPTGPLARPIPPFEGGVIFVDQNVAHAVPTKLHEAALQWNFGAPRGPVQPLGKGGDQAQFFSGGLVTSKDGTMVAWIVAPPR